MAPAAEFADNHSPVPSSPAGAQPTIPFIEVTSGPVPNEEAVVSESSLSQENNRSIRSTPANSFSTQQTSPGNGAQSSRLEPVEEIELPSRSSHADPSNICRQPSPEESIEYRHQSPTLATERNGSGNTPQPPRRQRSYATSFQDSLRDVYRYVPKYEITSTTIALLALALSAFFGYETYRLTKISTGAQLRQICIDEEVRGPPILNHILSSDLY
jgi:hypothetical protein